MTNHKFVEKLENYFKNKLKTNVSVYCVDGDIYSGIIIDWTSEFDNEPEGESITLRTKSGLMEIFIDEMESIEYAEEKARSMA